MFITVGSTSRACEVATLCGSIGKHATQVDQGGRAIFRGRRENGQGKEGKSGRYG